MNNSERIRPDWDTYGMIMAHGAAMRSPDPFVAVGAASFRKDHSTSGTGYNGVPSGIEIDWTDRELRRPLVVHAEENCLKYSKPGEAYYLYVTLLPCSKCLALAAAHGVKEIIYGSVYSRDSSTLVKAADYDIVLRQLDVGIDINVYPSKQGIN
jgi:hypothetical protein